MAGVTRRLVFAVISACWSAFQHGYNIGVLNTPHDVIGDWLQRNGTPVARRISIVVYCYCFGGIIGGLLTGVVAARLGRKGGLLANNMLVVLAVICESSADFGASTTLLAVGRFLIGINSGLSSGLAPLYLAEISPTSIRGSVCTVYQLMFSIGLLLCQGLGLVLGTPSAWPWLLAITIIPATLQCVMLPLCPESPKYLMNKGQDKQAQSALNWLRGDVNVDYEMEKMQQEAEKNKGSQEFRLHLFANRELNRPLFVVVVVMVAQQFSGINVLLHFGMEVFNAMSMSKEQSQFAQLGMCSLAVVMAVVSMFLVEVAGRKKLLLAGFGGMLACTVGYAIYTGICYNGWVPVGYVVASLYVAAYAVGPGPIPWFLFTELFNQPELLAATTVAVTVNWLASVITITLLDIVTVQQVLAQVVFIIFIYFKLPETKNKTVEEIRAEF